MSKIQINELNTNSLNEINEQEIKQVVGGFFDTTVFDDDFLLGVQVGTNTASITSLLSGANVIAQSNDQDLIQIA